MKTKENSSVRASTLQITFPVTLILLSATLLALASASAKDQFEQKPVGAGMALRNAQHRATESESSAPKPINAQKPAQVEFSPSLQRVGGYQIAGFSARQARTAQAENLTPPAGLKPVEQEAWLAMARRQEASSGTHFANFYPARYGDPFVVEGEGVRLGVWPVGGTDATVPQRLPLVLAKGLRDPVVIDIQSSANGEPAANSDTAGKCRLAAAALRPGTHDLQLLTRVSAR